ncbi:MAG: phage portal protein [Devosia sp.]|nr:phage portal protein [Devosia sp.]
MSLWENIKRRLPGRPPNAPGRDTKSYPNLAQLGQVSSAVRVVYKPTPRNLRYFSHTPYARRAVNAIKNPIAMLDWEIVPVPGVDLNPELKRQAEIVKTCFTAPNEDDSFRTLLEQVIEDFLCGAGAIEAQLGGDPIRPLWLWPVDGLSISIYPMWSGGRDEARYVQTIGYGSAFGGGQVAQLRNDELIYIRPNPTTATPFGFGPLEMAFTSIARILGVGEFAGNVATNARPSIMVYLGNGVDQEKLNTFRSWWKNDIEGQGLTPITASSAGDTDKVVGPQIMRLFPEGDAGLYLKYQEFLKAEIATAFDLSPMNLGVERDVNRNTAEVSEDRDWDQAIKPTALTVASYLTREAIQGKLGFSQLMFRFVGLDREDEEATAKIYEIYYKNNAITPNQQRDRLGQEPLDSEWADMTFADTQIAMQAARGAAQVDDPALTKGAPSKPKKD